MPKDLRTLLKIDPEADGVDVYRVRFLIWTGPFADWIGTSINTDWTFTNRRPYIKGYVDDWDFIYRIIKEAYDDARSGR